MATFYSPLATRVNIGAVEELRIEVVRLRDLAPETLSTACDDGQETPVKALSSVDYQSGGRD
jgi:hypothetical protein